MHISVAFALCICIKYAGTAVSVCHFIGKLHKLPHISLSLLERYAEVADYLGLGGKTPKDKLEKLIAAIRELRHKIGIKDTIADYGVSEKDFMATLDEMTENAFDDQCTGENPRYPLLSEIKQIYLNAYYGRTFTEKEYR